LARFGSTEGERALALDGGFGCVGDDGDHDALVVLMVLNVDDDAAGGGIVGERNDLLHVDAILQAFAMWGSILVAASISQDGMVMVADREPFSKTSILSFGMAALRAAIAATINRFMQSDCRQLPAAARLPA
jgi:hypothetical protein